jgi:hypothetical protein
LEQKWKIEGMARLFGLKDHDISSLEVWRFAMTEELCALDLMYWIISSTFGVPMPVTGSHPLKALNPLQVEAQALSVQILSPETMSLKAAGCSAYTWYKKGLANPILFCPFVSLVAFSKEMISATVSNTAWAFLGSIERLGLLLDQYLRKVTSA